MKRSQILKITAGVILLLFMAGCATQKASVQTSKPDTSAPVAKISTIQKISITEEENYTRVQIEGSEPIAPPLYKLLSDPLRIAIDVPNIDLKQIKSPLKVENGTIGDVLTTQYDDKGRIEISLLQMTNYNISNEEKDLIVDVEKVKKIEAPKEAMKEEETLKETKVEAPPAEPKKDESLPAPPMNKAKKVINVLFEEKKDSITFNILADGKIENFNAFKLDAPPRLVLDIWGVDTRKNSFKVKKSPLVKGVRVGHYPDKLRLVFDCKKLQLPPYQVNRIDDKLLVSLGNIPQPSEPQIYIQGKPAKESSGAPEAQKEKPSETMAKGEALSPDVKKEGPVEAKENVVKTENEAKKEEKPAPAPKKEEMKAEEKPILPKLEAKKANGEGERKVLGEGDAQRVYTGRKLSLDFKDADIKNILRLIAEVSNLNIIVADDVTGKVTMRLVDVPWDQALEIILQSKGLDKRQVGNVVRIAPVDALRKEDQARLEEIRSKEKMEPMVNDLIPINYATAKEIMPQVKGILSDRGDVKVDDRTNILIIKDIPKNIAAIRSLVKSLDAKTPQVIIEARIVEANLTFQEELGVDWGFLARGKIGGQTFSTGGGLTGTGAVSNLTTPPTATNPVVGLPALAAGGIGGIGTAGVLEMLMTSNHGLKQLDIAISAHENKGNAKIISSPKIATLDNKEASIEQGLRIPYRKLTTEGTITIDFIEANLKLTVTPHLTNDGNIKMIVKAKKDAPDKSITVDGVPSIDKKEAITEVMVKNNGVFVIAGVYSIEKDLGAEGIPLFNRIPIIGWLFKREAKQDLRRDLLIFISPKVVEDKV